MKKTSLIALTFTLALSLSACGGGEKASDAPPAADAGAKTTVAAVETTTAKQQDNSSTTETTDAASEKTEAQETEAQETETSEDQTKIASTLSPEELNALLTTQANEFASGFGNYNDQPIEWQVLDIDTDKQAALLITKDCIDVMEMDYDWNENYTWDNSNLCYWLNYEFRYFNFTQLERNKMLETVQENPVNSETGVSSGEPTDEWLFVLSMDEAREYFKEDADRVAYYNGEPQGWWLRTAGGETGWYAMVIHDDSGQIDANGSHEANSYGVRPACWVQLPGENPLLTTKVDASKVDAPLNPKAMLDDDVPEYYIDFTDEIVISYDVSLYNQALQEQLQSGYLRTQIDWSINSQDDWKCTGEDDWPDWLRSDYGYWADLTDDGDTSIISILHSNYGTPKENHYEEICYGITEDGEGFLNLTDNTVYFRLRFVASPETGDVYSPWSVVFAIGKDAPKTTAAATGNSGIAATITKALVKEHFDKTLPGGIYKMEIKSDLSIEKGTEYTDFETFYKNEVSAADDGCAAVWLYDNNGKTIQYALTIANGKAEVKETEVTLNQEVKLNYWTSGTGPEGWVWRDDHGWIDGVWDSNVLPENFPKEIEGTKTRDTWYYSYGAERMAKRIGDMNFPDFNFEEWNLTFDATDEQYAQFEQALTDHGFYGYLDDSWDNPCYTKTDGEIYLYYIVYDKAENPGYTKQISCQMTILENTHPANFEGIALPQYGMFTKEPIKCFQTMFDADFNEIDSIEYDFNSGSGEIPPYFSLWLDYFGVTREEYDTYIAALKEQNFDQWNESASEDTYTVQFKQGDYCYAVFYNYDGDEFSLTFAAASEWESIFY